MAKRIYKNQISAAMAEYREDFRWNREWWMERMGEGRNNEYLVISFKDGDVITVQADYFQYEGATCLPRFRAEDVEYISRYYGDGIETTTTKDIVIDTNRIILYREGVEYFRYEMTEEEYNEMRRQMFALDFEENLTKWMLDYCYNLAISKMNPTEPATEEPTETATEENELSNAGYCLDVYLNNDVDIYTKLTEPAIKAAAMGDEKLMEVYVINALKNAADLVRVNDGLKPTQKDIETVKAGYVAYILECAQYQNEMA